MKHLRFLALLLAAILLVGVLPALTVEAKGENNLQYWIGVDIKNQRTTIYRTADNSVAHCWLCSTGRSGYTTPVGTYHLPEARGNQRKEWFNFGSTYVKYAVKYTSGLYFHSVLFTRKSDNAMKMSTVKRLGHTASHGCIRLEVQHAKFICDYCPTGTMVVIHKGVDDPRITSILGHNASVETTPSLPAPPIVRELTLNQTGTVSLTKGETLQLSCDIYPANATTALRWKSSKPRYVSVDGNGLVTAVGTGAATITATASNGVKTTVKIDSVDPTIARSVTLDQKGIVILGIGETLQLNAGVDPASAASALTWKSSKPRYAAVDGSGLVTGVAAGSSKISVVTANRKKATVTVKVVDPYAPAKVSFTQSGPITLRVGETLQLSTALAPATARTTYTWASGKRRVAEVDADGIVTALKKGTAKITVRTANRKKATIVVKVVD
ncbi:MAG: Ig-like domain-containing protein [Clostridia bacterium]|nr:Ig-like domain-containing protein [Clostridia bacterium]